MVPIIRSNDNHYDPVGLACDLGSVVLPISVRAKLVQCGVNGDCHYDVLNDFSTTAEGRTESIRHFLRGTRRAEQGDVAYWIEFKRGEYVEYEKLYFGKATWEETLGTYSVQFKDEIVDGYSEDEIKQGEVCVSK